MSRTQASTYLPKNPLLLNGTITKDPQTRLENGMIITRPVHNIDNHRVRLSVTILLHKPAGYVCSDRHEGQRPSWRDLINDCPLSDDLRCA
jgi:16S rRNA U516 pseudouridylate synthase RsuA-like enzyme